MNHMLKFKSTDLIRLVEQRPLLWDRACVHYSNKNLKDQAWEDIYIRLYPTFNEFSRNERKILGDSITAKWRNLRDAFIRSVKRKFSSDHAFGVGKNYIYYEHLKFLLHRKKYRRDTTVTQSNIEYVDTVSQESLQNQVAPMEMMEVYDMRPATPEAEPADEVEHTEERDQVGETSARESMPELHHELDEHSMFFASITPTVRNLNEDEKLEFRIGTLELLRKIRQQRRANTNPVGSLPYAYEEVNVIKQEVQ